VGRTRADWRAADLKACPRTMERVIEAMATAQQVYTEWRESNGDTAGRFDGGSWGFSELIVKSRLDRAG
jgi:hypothetical protein